MKGNKLIVEFMGGKVLPDETVSGYTKINIPQWAFVKYDFDTLKVGGYEYHTSFDWLTPVVEKIETMVIKTNITSNIFTIRVNEDSFYDIVVPFKKLGISKLQGVWQGVSQFIEWYNKEVHENSF